MEEILMDMGIKINALQSQQQTMNAQIESLQSTMNTVKTQLQTIQDLVSPKEQVSKQPQILQRLEPDGKRVFELPEGSTGVSNWQKISYKSRLTQVLGKKTWSFISNLAISGKFDDPSKTYRDIARDILKYALKQREDLEYKISEFRESVQFTLPQTARLLEEKLIEVLKKKKYESKKREKTDPCRRANEALAAELKEIAELHPGSNQLGSPLTSQLNTLTSQLNPPLNTQLSSQIINSQLSTQLSTQSSQLTPPDLPRLNLLPTTDLPRLNINNNVLSETFLHPIPLDPNEHMNQRKRKGLASSLDSVKKRQER